MQLRMYILGMWLEEDMVEIDIGALHTPRPLRVNTQSIPRHKHPAPGDTRTPAHAPRTRSQAHSYSNCASMCLWLGWMSTSLNFELWEV